MIHLPCCFCIVWLFKLMPRWHCCCCYDIVVFSVWVFFFLSGFALSRSTLHMRLRLLLHDQIPRYRRLYHFVGIRDWWSAIIVDTLFGGQLIHSYIKDINTSLTYHFWLSGYPASSSYFFSFVPGSWVIRCWWAISCHQVGDGFTRRVLQI